MVVDDPRLTSSLKTPCSPPGGEGRRYVRRPSIFSVVVVTLIGALASACATPPPNNPNNACDIFAQRRGWWDAVRDTERNWGMPAEIQLAIVYRESSFNQDARPAREGGFLFIPGRRPSSAFGYAQATDSTWDWYRRDTGRSRADRDNFRDAVDFVGWYGAKSRELSGISMDDAYDQYLAYHNGHGGYNRGSHRSDSRVRRLAQEVSDRANLYRRQLATCRDDLNRRFLFFF